MASTEITLPGAWMQAYRLLFPTIDFLHVHFYLGIPPPLAGGEGGNTAESWNGQNVYLAATPNLCDPTFGDFLLLAHELVHVLQIQKGVRLSWPTRYVACFIASGLSTSVNNCFEVEAYSYANGTVGIPGLLAGKLAPGGGRPPPYRCDATFVQPPTKLPMPRFNPEFATFIAMHPELTKTKTTCTIGDCLRESVSQFNVGGLILDAVAIVLTPFIFIATLGGFNVGVIVGAVVGLIGGSILGALIGTIAGTLIGIFTAFLGAALGGLIGGLIQDLIDFIFGGDSGGSLNVVFSSGFLNTFTNRSSFERTREQFAAVLADDGVFYVGWTGLDDQLNFVAFSGDPTLKRPKISFERSNHCGPAIARDPNNPARLVFAWQGNDNRLNLLVSPGAAPRFPSATKLTLDRTHSDPEATPSVVFADDSTLFLAWIESSGFINLWVTSTVDGNWILQERLDFQSIGS